jgi:hypothetical protein
MFVVVNCLHVFPPLLITIREPFSWQTLHIAFVLSSSKTSKYVQTALFTACAISFWAK